MRPRLWVFNYNFEWALSRRPVEPAGLKSAWYQLNRSSTWLAPLMTPGDSLLCYQAPPPRVQEDLARLLGFVPQWLVIAPPVETNNPFLDAKNSGLDLKQWDLACFGDVKPQNLWLNSKLYSHTLRERFLPDWACPKAVALPWGAGFEAKLTQALAAFPQPFLIKDALGTAGRMRLEGQAHPKIKSLCTWAKASGGILLEERLEKVQEWSLHFDCSEASWSYVGQTQLFSTTQGGYQGSRCQNFQPPRVLWEALGPLLDQLVADGARGPVGLDFLETPPGHWVLLEINLRYSMGRLALEWQKRLGWPGLQQQNQRVDEVSWSESPPYLIRWVAQEKEVWLTFLQALD